MTLLVDTSVWSMALRRDGVVKSPEVVALNDALAGGQMIVTTGIILQELLQGFSGPKAGPELIARFEDFPLVQPSRETHIKAATLRNHCRRNGVQTGTVDALIAQICIEHDLTLLTADKDFYHMARHCPLRLMQFRVST